MRRPPSGWLRTSSSAPCAVLTDWAMDRPRPTPPPLLPIRRNGSVSVGTASAGTRAPLLAMVRTTPRAHGPVITRIQPPGSLCRTALSTRFQTIRSMSCWSPVVSAGESSRLYPEPEPGDAGRGQLEGVLGHRRQVQQLAAGHALIADGQDQQRLDHVLGPVDVPADPRRHVLQLLRRPGRLGQGDVDGGAHDGERRAELVRGVRDEPALGGEREVQPFQHVVEGIGQFLELVARRRSGPAAPPGAGPKPGGRSR